MQQIADWLNKLDMSEYAERFAENDIDIDVLGELRDQDLEKLGVSLGHRRKMLRAIRELCNQPIAVAAGKPAAQPRIEPQRDVAERRQVTVMFCDMVGSTALSARMDPEDLREVISVYQKCVTDTTRRFDGFVAKYMGDGVLVYFGYPQAHEDDAERAVRAGLELIAAVAGLETRASLQTRLGIATGVVVVGDLIGSGEAQERGIVGETPNLAARLEGIAEPGEMVISESTRRLVGGTFEYRDLGGMALKGLVDPVQAWQVTGISAVHSRFEAKHGSGLTPLVGRDEELEFLLRRWRQSAGGGGCVVLLAGEPGIGKSRLTVALQERLQDEPHTRLRYFSSPHHTDSAFYPVISQLDRAAGFAPQDTPSAKFHKLSSLVSSSGDDDADHRLLAELLSIPAKGSYTPLDLNPQRKKEKILEALRRQLELLCNQHPVLMVFEDAHWIDPSSRELLDMIVERVVRLPVLLVITFRPEFRPPWTGQAHVTLLNISRLDRDEGAALAGSLAGTSLPGHILAEIVERADGIPLFVEELTKAVVETGADDQGIGKTVSRAPHPLLNVPATLHASLMARLDHLGSAAKEIAQVAAAIGREFSYELLTVVAQQSEEVLNASLQRLIDAGLVFRRGAPPQEILLFKHALVRDVAYGMLLRGDRRQNHARIGQALEQQLQDAPPEILAHHFSEAGLPDKAIAYWVQAGERATLRSAYAEALSHLNKGLDLLGELPDARERDRCELSLRAALGAVYAPTEGYAATETVAAFKRAAELLQATGNARLRLVVHNGLFVGYYVLAQFESGLDLAQAVLYQGEADGDDVIVCVAHRMMAAICSSIGEFERTAYHARQGWELYQPDRHGLAALGLVHDTGIGAKLLLALALCQLGFQHQANEVAVEGLALAAALRHVNTQAYAWFYGGVLISLVSRDYGALTKYAQQLRAYAQQQGMPQWAALARAFGALPLVISGCAVAAMDEVTAAISDCERAQSFSFRPAHLTILALAELAAGRAEQALAATAGALELAERTREHWFTAETWRVRGQVLLSAGRLEPATECFERALVVARSQSARLFELRAATSLARLWCNQGKYGEARDLLAPIYGWFTEGFDTADLREAKALLDELALGRLAPSR
jgi:class 3 adenylate cyclase/tetratricopeptide (TPR) repeat protein